MNSCENICSCTFCHPMTRFLSFKDAKFVIVKASVSTHVWLVSSLTGLESTIEDNLLLFDWL